MLIGSKICYPTAISSTTKTQLNGAADVILPTWSKSILAVVPYMINVGTTVTESVVAKIAFESSEVNLQPLEFLLNPIGGGLGAASAPLSAKPDKWPVNIPVNGGEHIQVWGTGLINNTIEPQIGAAIVVSDQPPAGKQRYAKVGTYTNCGAVNVETKGTDIQINGISRIVELYGFVAPNGVIVTVEGFGGFLSYKSNDFQQAVPLEIPFCPAGGGVGAGITVSIDGMLRMPVSVPTKSNVLLENYCKLSDTVTNTIAFDVGVIYEK